jgi:hypothetical protein
MTQPAAQPAATDKVTLWGVLGIVFGVCCWPLGVVFSVLGLQEAKRVGKPPTLAYIGFGLAAVFAVLSIINALTGAIYSFNTK